MPRIDNPKNPIIAHLEGLHLFHFDGAPCAQRVRFALADKGIPRGREVRFDAGDPASCRGEDGRWVSRIVSLVKKEHLSPAYASIQPNMVVPALVHDGVLFTESMDIVEYLDQTFGGDSLIPGEVNKRAEVEALVSQGKDLHVSIRYVTFRWGLGRLGVLNGKEEAQLKVLAAEGADAENLVQFYSSYDRGTIPMAVYDKHLLALYEAFNGLDHRLRDGCSFLTGRTLTMADIIWAMKVLRLKECGYPFATLHPFVDAWFERIAKRPSFQQGVMGKHKVMNRAFRAKAWIENQMGVGLAGAVQRVAATGGAPG